MDENCKADLGRWLAAFLDALRHRTRLRICPIYIAGLIGIGDRKSIQPMAARDSGVGYVQLHHFIASGVWNAAPLEKVLLAEADRQVGGDGAWLIIDDTEKPPSELSKDSGPPWPAYRDIQKVCLGGTWS